MEDDPEDILRQNQTSNCNIAPGHQKEKEEEDRRLPEGDS